MLKQVFTPIKIGSLEVPNRFVVPPMVVNFVNQDGTANEKFIAYHEEKAKGGWGLIIVEDYAIDKYAGGFIKLPGLWNDGQIESHRELTERVHQYDSKIFAQIYHAGRETGSLINGVQPVAPSPIADPTIGETPRELSITEIKELIEKFGDTALRAKKAGFDGVEMHGAHGYLIGQFMSPFSNKRTDEYGGTIKNRARFALEILKNIRAKVGNDFPVIYRMSVNEMVTGGLTTEESKVIVMLLEEAGIDAIHASNGVYASSQYIIPPFSMKHAWSSDISEEIKKVVSIPVIGVGRITDPFIAESVIASGKADLVSMGRASLADPHLPKKSKEGKFEDIIHCIGCVQGCSGRNVKQVEVKCLVNPLTGSESERKIELVKDKKIIAVAGGGIAGMEAAIVAAKRGHVVHLYEKNEKLGGQWILAAIPPSKEEFNSFILWQKTQLEKLNVNIHLGTEFNEKIVEEIKPDALIVATGSIPFVPNITGKDRPNVVIANDILKGKIDSGQNVVVIGGGMVGVETASHLANHGKSVTIMEAKSEIFEGGEPAVRYFLFEDLKENNVRLIANAFIKEIKEKSVIFDDEKGNEKELSGIDTIVMAVGSKPLNDLSEIVSNKIKKVIVAGDAVSVRNGLDAIEEGFLAGLEV